MHVVLDRVPLRDADARARGDPHERVAGTHVRGRRAGEHRRGSWRSAPSGTSRRPSSARSPTATGSTIEWHGELVVEVPPRTVAHEGPVYERPFARPGWQDALQADAPTPQRLPRPGDGDRAARDAAADGRLAEPGRQGVGHQPVRPLRAGQHRPGAAGRRRHGPHRRARPGSASRSPPTATVATASSTRTPAPSSRWPRRTATSRRPAPRPLAVTNCLNFGSPEDPDGDVAVRRGRARARRRLRRARHPGHRRQRQLLQPDRRRRDPARRRWSACSA